MYHVAYCFDKNFIQHFCAAVTSALLNFSHPPSQLTFHLVTDNEDADLAAFIEATNTKFGCHFCVYVLNDANKSVLDRIPASLRTMGHFTVAVYFRLLIPALVPETLDRILYLDSDTIVVDDISKLIDTPLGGCALALALDPKSEILARVHHIDEYFNSGVALFDLEQWRAHDWATKCFDYLENPKTPILNVDQCAINVVLNGKIKKLDPRWNGCTYGEYTKPSALKDVRETISIIHYVSKNKPWQAWYQNGHGRLYWTYLDASQWRNAVPIQPTTVNEYILMARKHEAEGQAQQANAIYVMVTDYLLKKK
jgi:lipopolysaccharide biosynthesis glycosyltransferase